LYVLWYSLISLVVPVFDKQFVFNHVGLSPLVGLLKGVAGGHDIRLTA